MQKHELMKNAYYNSNRNASFILANVSRIYSLIGVITINEGILKDDFLNLSSWYPCGSPFAPSSKEHLRADRPTLLKWSN